MIFLSKNIQTQDILSKLLKIAITFMDHQSLDFISIQKLIKCTTKLSLKNHMFF